MRLFVLTLVFLLTGCGRDTNDAEKSYKYWAGGDPPSGIVPLKGKFWKSMHFTYEYEVYLHLKMQKSLRDDFFRLNNIQPTGSSYDLPGEAPEWFKPPRSGVVYSPGGIRSQNFYVVDTTKDEIYIHEIQL